jgi:hypothetical protein
LIGLSLRAAPVLASETVKVIREHHHVGSAEHILARLCRRALYW